MKAKNSAVALFATASLALTAACGGGGGGETAVPVVTSGNLDELVAAAKKEGSLTYYSSIAQDQIDVLTQAFTKKYGIKVEVLRLNSGELVQRYSAEAQGGSVRADALEYASPEVFNGEPQWFTALNENEIPALADWPDNAKQPRSLVTSLFPYSVTYNTDLVPKPPTTWSQLAGSEWKGRISLVDPRTSPSYIGWADAVEKEFGPEYLSKLGALQPELAQSATPGAQQVAAGAFAVNFPSMPVHPLPLKASGAPVDYQIISDPPIKLAINMGISAQAPHPNAARLFASWRLTQEGQVAACSKGSVSSPISLNNEIEGCLPLESDWRLIEYGLGDARTNELLDLLGISG